MAKYTITLRDIIYHFTQDQNPYNITADANGRRFMKDYDVLTVGERIKKAENSFLAGVTFESTEMKDSFWENFCIVNLMREIEYETVEYFLLRFRAQLNLLLPKYNPLYASTKLEIERLKSFERTLHREGEDDTTSTAQGQTDTNGNSRSVFEDTPENRLGNADYATNITNNTGEDHATTNNSGRNDRDYHEDVTESGYTTPQAELLQKYRETLITAIADLVKEVSSPIFCKIY